MKKRLRHLFCTIITITLITNVLALSIYAQRQRPRRATAPAPQSISLARGSRLLPRGYVIELRTQTRLNSGISHPGDRFEATIAEAITDEGGSLVLPASLLVIGQVKAVTPAQLGRRSGVIEIAFDKLRMPDGRELPIEAVLTSADPAERRSLKIDEEGALGGTGSHTKRSIVFIGAGTASGAVIGSIAGGAMMGAGIGAAAGAVAALLAKGKEAIVEPGTLIALELIEPLDLTRRGVMPPPPIQTLPTPPPAAAANNPPPVNNTTSINSNTVNNTPREPVITSPVKTPTSTPATTPAAPPATTPTTPPATAPATTTDTTNPLEPQLLKWSFVQAERVSGGSILIVITAETSSSGWKVKADHKINGDTLEVWVNGTPPEGRASKVTSHPTVTTTVADQKRGIRSVIVHGTNGDRVITLPPPGRL